MTRPSKLCRICKNVECNKTNSAQLFKRKTNVINICVSLKSITHINKLHSISNKFYHDLHWALKSTDYTPMMASVNTAMVFSLCILIP